LVCSWNVSFEQEYGSGLNHAGNATIASLVFRKLDADAVGVSIRLDNSNFRGPVPAYTVVPWSPSLETGILLTGLMVTVVSLVFRKLVLWGSKVDSKYERNIHAKQDQYL
jgi:hypothetical protein